MEESFAFFLNVLVTLFSVLDPFGAAVVLLALTPDEAMAERRRQARKASWVAFFIILLFTLLGAQIFYFFGVTIPAIRIAGGLILLQVAFKMLEGNSLTYRSSQEERMEGEKKEEVAIIPMAIPILAGPAAIAAVMVFAEKAGDIAEWAALIAGVTVALFLTFLILHHSVLVIRWLGETGVKILVRAMGLILIAMGVEFVISGARNYFSG